jgi:hypothetical protein
MILDTVMLPCARLQAQVHRDAIGDRLCLQRPGGCDTGLSFPLDDTWLSGALARFTRLGRWHALYWSLAYGHVRDDSPPVPVTFRTDSLRHQLAAAVPSVPLADRYWVADVDGIFDVVTVGRPDQVTASRSIPRATRC